MKKQKKTNKYHFLIKKFIKDPNKFQPKDWARETKIAKKLYEVFDNEKFWKQSFLDFKLNSLAWFLSQDGLKFLKNQFLLLKIKLPKSKVIELGNIVYQSKEKLDKTPKTVIDFLEGE